MDEAVTMWKILGLSSSCLEGKRFISGKAELQVSLSISLSPFTCFLSLSTTTKMHIQQAPL